MRLDDEHCSSSSRILSNKRQNYWPRDIKKHDKPHVMSQKLCVHFERGDEN